MTPSPPGLGYRLISFFLLPLWLVHAFWHGYRQGFSRYFKLRILGSKNHKKQPVVWIHAASVGEVQAVTPLVRRLRDQGESILFTSFTATGYRTIEHNFADSVGSGIIPIEFGWNCRRFIHKNNIKLCLLMETELWPELLYQAAHKGISIIQINARLSRKTLDVPRQIRDTLQRTMGYVSLHLTRNNNDKDKLVQLGAVPQNIKIVGNLKSAAETSTDYPNLINRDYVLLASSHDGEEKLLLSGCPTSLKKPLIVMAPRHPSRSKAIQNLLSQSGFNFAIRSLTQKITAETEIYLADTLGELKALMAHAKIVVMGGSFDQTGGHNLIEPAVLGCAIITGPSDNNIREDISLLGNGIGIFQVRDIDECWEKVSLLLGNPDRSKALGQQAQQAVRKRSDVLENYLIEIKPYL